MRACLLLLLIASCTRPAGDSLVVVTVNAASLLDNIARLHTSSTAGGRTIDRDVGPASDASTFAIPPAQTFGVQLSPSITGVFAIHVEAQDASGTALAAGDGMVTLAPGGRVDLSLLLGVANADMANADMANADMAMFSPILSEPIWIGPGGSASSATQQLNLHIGGFDTSGTVNAPSGAQLTSGFFAHQTN